MTARADLATAVAASEVALDGIFAPLAPAIRQSVERHAEKGLVTHNTRRGVLHDVDVLLSAIYPLHRGAPSILASLIVAHANAAALKPIDAEVERIRRALKDEPLLLARMEAGG